MSSPWCRATIPADSGAVHGIIDSAHDTSVAAARLPGCDDVQHVARVGYQHASCVFADGLSGIESDRRIKKWFN